MRFAITLTQLGIIICLFHWIVSDRDGVLMDKYSTILLPCLDTQGNRKMVYLGFVSIYHSGSGVGLLIRLRDLRVLANWLGWVLVFVVTHGCNTYVLQKRRTN